MRSAAGVAFVIALCVCDTHTAAPRAFPDTSARIGILTDQFPEPMSDAQVRFAATHFVGTQKSSLPVSKPLRAINPGFIVLHYHLAMWQSSPRVPFVIDGTHWASDFSQVDPHESWFWHNPSGQRVASNQDGKFLMNVADPGLRAYWRESIAKQVAAGDYDGVFLDSASPALLNWEARTPPDPRLAGTGVRSNTFAEFGGRNWIAGWQDWITDLDAYLASRNIPLIPNVGGLTTTWDNSDYTLTSGAFSEGFLDPAFDPADWVAAANQTLAMVRKNRIVILQNYLKDPADVARRKFLLASYLLVKGNRTYLAYFAKNALDWYPEWALDLGAASTSATTVDDLKWRGVLRREFAKGIVVLNPTNRAVRVDLGASLHRVDPAGGGSIGRDGAASGTLAFTSASSVELGPKSAEILLR